MIRRLLFFILFVVIVTKLLTGCGAGDHRSLGATCGPKTPPPSVPAGIVDPKDAPAEDESGYVHDPIPGHDLMRPRKGLHGDR